VKRSTQTEYAPMRRVLLKTPRDAFVSTERIRRQWQQLGYTSEPDLARAIDEHETLVEKLRELGADPQLLPEDDRVGIDSLYPRDAAVICQRGAVLCRMGKKARRVEPVALGEALVGFGIPILGAIESPGTLEGGDVAWIDDQTLVAGRGYRTNDEGIRQLAILLGPEVEVLRVPLPHWRGPGDVFHLMSMLSPLDEDLLLVYSPLLPVPFRELLIDRGYGLVEVPEEEFGSMGCNVLAVSPRCCIAVSGNPETRARMEKAGVEVHVLDGSEICIKGEGGPTCLTRPIERLS
jgi:N-dimethylarginine dimethylaminohydrolase